MTILTSAAEIILPGDGINSTFAFSFVYGSSAWISVTYTDADLVETVLAPASYTLTLTPPAANTLWGVGGSVTLGFTPATGTTITIRRTLPLTQVASFLAQAGFSPRAIEQALDRLEMQIQQVDLSVTLGLRDAGGFPIINVGDPQRPTDAANAQWVEALFETLAGDGPGIVPENWAYTGDGTTTVFSVSTTQTVGPTATFFVTLNGVDQVPITDFNVNGSSQLITFVTAPPSGAQINIRSFGYAKNVALAAQFVQKSGDTMTGQLNGAAGTAAAPGFAFDSTAGLFRPAVNTVAISTSGVERMRLAASGNIGIKTTTPLASTQIGSTSSATQPTLGSPNSVALAVSATDSQYGLVFGANSAGNAWLQAMRLDGVATSYNILLQPSGGYVGFGNIAPAAFADAGTAGSTQTLPAMSARGRPNAFEWGHPNPAGYANTFGYFSSSGAPYVVFNAEAGTTINTFRTRGVVGRGYIGDNAGGMRWFTVPLANADNQAPSYDLGLTASGAMYIGTSAARISPSSGYAIATYGSGNSYWVLNANTNFNSAVYFGDPSSDTVGGLVYAHNGDFMFAQVNGAEAWRTTSTFSFGLGTSTPNLGSNTRAITINDGTAANLVAYELATAGVLRSYFRGNDSGTYLRTVTAAPVYFGYNGSDVVQIGNNTMSIGSAPTPAATLDVNGSVAYRSGGLTLVNGANQNAALPATEYVRITGPTGAFNIGGLTGGVNGRIVTLHNTVAFAMTLNNEDAGSTAGNRITTLTGANVTLRAGTSAATLQYDATASRWILINYN
jgi:hypothetical protein